MKISTEIGSIAKFVGYEKAIEYVAKAGFDSWDFTMCSMMCTYDKSTGVVTEKHPELCSDGYLEYARRLGELGASLGITCNQAHAPFPSLPPMMPYIRRAIECAGIVGARICVVHPWNYSTPEENAAMYRELLPLAKRCGVKIAVENMWNWWDFERDIAIPAACSLSDNFVHHVDLVGDPDLVACLDIGHAEMFRAYGENAPGLIRALGKRLKAVHMHDNDLRHDSHALPYTMGIDFHGVLKALAETGYEGDMTLEADTYTSSSGGENVYRCVEAMCESAKRLREDFFEMAYGNKKAD